MLSKIKIKNGVKVLVACIAVFSLIGFSESKHSAEVCSHIMVKIENQYDNYFIDDNDVLSLMNKNGEDVVIGKPFGKLNLKGIEERIKSDKFIKSAQIYRDLRGEVVAEVALRRPLARVLRKRAPDAYIATDGTVLPTSSKFTSRVVLISGAYTKELVKENMLEQEGNRKIFELVKFINNDQFWKSQITQIDIDANGEIILYPQVTKQYVEFGKAERIEDKLKRLMIFYKEILPRKGWNSYKKVCLKFEGQVLAE